MARKKNKKENWFPNRLASQLQQGHAGDLQIEAANQGFTSDGFAADFEQAQSILQAGPDPRKIVKMHSVFQLAFLKLAEQEQDDDQINDLLTMTEKKEVMKEAKRILHRMRSQGLEVSTPDESGSSVLDRRVAEDVPVLPCYLTPITSLGSRMIWLASYVHGGVGVYQAEINDQEGLLEFSGGVIGRSRYRNLSKEILAKEKNAMLEISYAEARHRIIQAVSVSRKNSRALPEGYLEASSRLPEPGEPEPLANPRQIYHRDSIQEPSELIHKATELHELPEFVDWVPNEDAIKRFHAKLKEIESSQITINARQKVEQIDKAMDQVVIDMLEDNKPLNQDRLFEMVLHLHRTNQHEQAKWAAASAWQLDDEGFQPLDSPFFRRMVRKMFKSPEEIFKYMETPARPDSPDTSPSQETPPESGNLIVPP